MLSRNYKAKIVEDSFKRVREVQRKDALKRVSKVSDDKQTPLVITYYPALPSVSGVVRKHWQVRMSVPDYKGAFLNHLW